MITLQKCVTQFTYVIIRSELDTDVLIRVPITYLIEKYIDLSYGGGQTIGNSLRRLIYLSREQGEN